MADIRDLGSGITATPDEINALSGQTASAAELSKLDENTVGAPEDAAWASVLRVAKATYDFAEHGGAISAIDLGVTIPDNALIVGSSVDVITTATSAGDAGTMALSVEGANDIVAAVAINDAANPWDAGSGPALVVNPTDADTHVKTTQPRQVTATIAAEAFTAGKFVVYLFYVIAD